MCLEAACSSILARRDILHTTRSTLSKTYLPVTLLPNLPLVDTLDLPLNADEILFQFVQLLVPLPRVQ